MDREIEAIAIRLNGVVKERVQHLAVIKGLDNKRFKELVDIIQDLHDKAQRSYDEMKGSGLSLSMADSEGYLRCCKLILSIAQEPMFLDTEPDVANEHD